MENTAIEEHKSRKQYLDESSSKLSGGEITNFEDTCEFGYKNILKVVYFAMNRHELTSRKELQAKHEEELKQAVIKAIKTDVFPLMDEANFIAKNLKDNPYCTVYRLHELNKNIEGKYGIEIEYTPTGKL
jgi:hypothetical protein